MEDGQGVLSSIAAWHPPSWEAARASTPRPRTHVPAALSSWPGSDLPPLGRTVTPGVGVGFFFVLVTPRERDAAEAAGSLLQVPGGVRALLRQREMPLPRGRKGAGLRVRHHRRGCGSMAGGGGWDAVPSLPGRAGGEGHGHRGSFSDPPSSASPVPPGRCERGYTGARCERVDIFYLRGDRGQIVIISLIAAIVTLIILVICACLCSQYVGLGG